MDRKTLEESGYEHLFADEYPGFLGEVELLLEGRKFWEIFVLRDPERGSNWYDLFSLGKKDPIEMAGYNIVGKGTPKEITDIVQQYLPEHHYPHETRFIKTNVPGVIEAYVKLES